VATATWHLLSRLVAENVFELVPDGGLNPLKLPRETYVEEAGKGPGRRSKGERALLARQAVEELDGLVRDLDRDGLAEVRTKEAYLSAKEQLLSSLDDAGQDGVVEAAGSQTLANYALVSESAGMAGWTVLDRAEKLLERVQ
jgi:hypothetical protein